jgi:hypothetical protein
MPRLDIRWAAGLFEGEGCAWLLRSKDHARCYTYLTVKMTDRDVVESFKRVMECGTVRRQPRAPGRRDVYEWQVGARDDVVRCTRRLLPYLHARRRARVLAILEGDTRTGIA